MYFKFIYLYFKDRIENGTVEIVVRRFYHTSRLGTQENSVNLQICIKSKPYLYYSKNNNAQENSTHTCQSIR